jgi:hypothetical protein
VIYENKILYEPALHDQSPARTLLDFQINLILSDPAKQVIRFCADAHFVIHHKAKALEHDFYSTGRGCLDKATRRILMTFSCSIS